MEAYIHSVIAVGGTLLGIFFGSVFTHFLEKGRNKESRILETKIEAYSEVGGLARNIATQKFDPSKLGEFNIANSKALLFADKKLGEELRCLGSKIHTEKQRDGAALGYSFSKDATSEIIDQIYTVESLMKKELELDKNNIFSQNETAKRGRNENIKMG